jgi:hypothetical protein
MPFFSTYANEAEYVARQLRKHHPDPDMDQVKRAYFEGTAVVQWRVAYHPKAKWADLRPWHWTSYGTPSSNVSWAPHINYRIKPEGEEPPAPTKPPQKGAPVAALTKFHYNTFARALAKARKTLAREHHETVPETFDSVFLRALATQLRATNPQFDPQRFIAACKED